MLSAGIGALGIVGGMEMIRRGISGIISEASNLENAVADFTTLTGSAENARETVQDLQALGAATPFEFGDLSSATRLLLGFGAATRENLIPTLRMLGDTAGGNAQRLDSITLAFSQIAAGGRASMQDINQLINAGVPIVAELARMWGVNIGQARQMISQGRATGEVVSEAFRNMTSEGGMFHRGMERASQTLTGRFSTFTDNVKIMAATIGTALLPQLKAGLEVVNGWVEGIQQWATSNKDAITAVFSAIGKALGVIAEVLPYVVGWFIAYKVALMGAAAWQATIAAIGFVGYMAEMLPIMRASIAAQGLYNFLLGGTALQAALATIATKAMSIWQGVQTAATWLATTAQWALNAAFYAFPLRG